MKLNKPTALNKVKNKLIDKFETIDRLFDPKEHKKSLLF